MTAHLNSVRRDVRRRVPIKPTGSDRKHRRRQIPGEALYTARNISAGTDMDGLRAARHAPACPPPDAELFHDITTNSGSLRGNSDDSMLVDAVTGQKEVGPATVRARALRAQAGSNAKARAGHNRSSQTTCAHTQQY